MQLQVLAMRAAGADDEGIKAHWERQHERAAQHMYQLAVDLRGFYLKASRGCGGWGEVG